jgi:hypothetical protein
MGLAYPAYPQPGRVEYRVQGTLPGLAAQVDRLATTLGVKGTVSADSLGWTVTGSAGVLHVTRTAGLPCFAVVPGSSKG